MADIDVKRRSPVWQRIWPFVVGAIVLALLAWGLIRLFDRDEDWRIDPPAAGPEQTTLVIERGEDAG